MLLDFEELFFYSSCRLTYNQVYMRRRSFFLSLFTSLRVAMEVMWSAVAETCRDAIATNGLD